MKQYNFDLYKKHREKAIAYYFNNNEKYVTIKNYGQLVNNPPLSERKKQRNFLRKANKRFLGYIIYNANIYVKTTFRIGLLVEKNIPFQFNIAHNYEDAIEKALIILDKKTLKGIEKQDPNEEIIIKRKDLDQLQYRLSTLSWDIEEDHPDVDEEHPLKSLYNIIDLVENDHFNALKSLRDQNINLNKVGEQLENKNLNLQTIVDNIPIGISLVEKHSKKITLFNNTMKQMLDIEKGKILGKTCFNLFCNNGLDQCIYDSPEPDIKIENESCRIGKIPVLKNAIEISIENKKYILMSFIDISDQKEVERKNREFQNDLILLSNCATDLIFLNNTNSILKYVCKGINEFVSNSIVVLSKFIPGNSDFKVLEIYQDGKLNVSIDENSYINRKFILDDDVFFHWLNEHFINITSERSYFPEVIEELYVSSEHYRNVYVSGFSYNEHLFGNVFIITNKKKIKNKEIINSFVSQASMTLYKRVLEENLVQEKEQVETSLKTKEILLKEVHHRVKNNMAVISSLLKLQAMSIKDPKLNKAFEESRNRIKSMALVHEKLYDRGDLARLDIGDYITTLLKYLLTSYKARFVEYEIKTDNIFVNLDTSVSLGLLINEIFTNSLKYAFADEEAYVTGEKTAIVYAYFTSENNIVELKIGDNGKGLPEKDIIEKRNSLGMELIHSLSQQIDAILQINCEKGTEYIIRFSNNDEI